MEHKTNASPQSLEEMFTRALREVLATPVLGDENMACYAIFSSLCQKPIIKKYKISIYLYSREIYSSKSQYCFNRNKSQKAITQFTKLLKGDSFKIYLSVLCDGNCF
jgi:hypothetical protein